MNVKTLLILIVAATVWTSCSESKVQVEETKNEETPIDPGKEDDGSGGEYETYMANVDSDTNLIQASTLYYSKPNGESYQVYLLVDDSANIVKMEARYTLEGSSSVLRTFFYYKNGIKHATRELRIEGAMPNEQFKELVTYYEENGEPAITKRRMAKLEEDLEYESFRIITPTDCSDERAMQALQNEAEFQTNFISTIAQDGVYYINVGQNGGFTSSLVVQEITPLVQQMLTSPESFKGKEVRVQFSEVPDGSGFTFQALLGIQLVQS